MTVVKATFSLDPKTVRLLDEAARCLAKPKSEIVRDAIRDYSARIGRLSEEERLRRLAAFDERVPKIPERPPEEVDREICAIRESRRTGGRGTPVERSCWTHRAQSTIRCISIYKSSKLKRL